jgi:hypothetical protein
MPPPLSAYIEAAKRFAKLESDDVAVVEDFYVRVFPDLPKAKTEKILDVILAHEGPARQQTAKQPVLVSMTPLAAPPHSPPRKLARHPTIATIPSFFGAALARSFTPVARMPRRL